MRRLNLFRSKQHNESSQRSQVTTALKTNTKPFTIIHSNHPTPTQPITISAPIINPSDNALIDDKDQSDENPNEEQTSTIENDNIEEQTALLQEPKEMSDEYNRTDDQPVASSSTSSNQSSSSIKKIDSTIITTTTTMVGNNPKEDVLISCKATAMLYNDAQKKWIHCAPSGPAKVQLLFASDTQTYRIVGRQIQDHEVVLNHAIGKGIKYNQATPTFHQWRDQSSVYGLNFGSKLDAQEFGATMMKILESVNSSTNLSSQTNANGGVTLPSSTLNNNNNNNNNGSNATSHKRQANQPSSSLLPTPTTVSISSTYTSSISEPQQQQQQQQSSSSYNNQLRSNLNPIVSSSTPSNSNNYYSQHHQPTEEEETNYAHISDSYPSYSDNSTNKNNNIPQPPSLNLPMSTAGSAPPPAAPPPPPPPPPLPSGFGNGPPSAPALVLPTANGNNGANTPRKSSTAAPAMDLMSEMAAKFAQRRKQIDEGEKTDSSNALNVNKSSPKLTPATTLPATTAPPIPTSPRIARKGSESHLPPNLTSNDLEKLKTEILTEIRKDIEKAKQEILTAILDRQKPTFRK